MNIKINKKIFSIPPHLSTRWENIQSISMINNDLQVILIDGTIVSIPNLDPALIEKIFTTHASILEQPTLPKTRPPLPFNPEMGENTFQIGFAAVDEMGSVVRHNPAQANSPDLPPPVLEKIAALAKALAPDDITAFPKPEPNCNCMHCQIARAINKELAPTPNFSLENIKPDDLKFEQWEIHQSGDKMFSVINKLDPTEQYTVYLGSPVGCTCGQPNCEHIVAVLKS